ncbi:MAG TPA: hypothetical protein VG456_12670 [Candidatus Sulfopaludibacter sp.]|jgi:hypothetical protein|nr:hypothetical protein [Candidatus Sulfopaludibacter sp.]
MSIQNVLDLPDTCARQRDLDEFEAGQQEELARFAAQKMRENRNLESELDRISAQFHARMESNMEEVVRFQEALRAWERWKQRETARLTASDQPYSR